MTTSQSQYVISPWLTPVRVAATSNVTGTYYNGPNNNGVGATFTIAASSLTIDSVTVIVGDRVLLTDQTSGFQNGIYIVESIGATVVLQRAFDQQSLEQIQTGQYVSVKGGSIQAGSFFSVIEPRPQQMGVSNIVFAEEGAAAAGVTFSGPASTAGSLVVFSNTAGDIQAEATTATSAYGITAATGNLTATAGNVSATVGAVSAGSTVTAGTGVTATTGNIVATAGNLAAGSSGHAGTVSSFPATASKGSLALVGVANTGNTVTTISNAAMGQASVVSIPDPGAATATFAVAPAALVSGNFVEASGTAGLIEDSGVTVASVSSAITQLGNLYQTSVTLNTAAVVGAYATPQVLIAPVAGKVIIVHSATVYTASTGNTAFASGIAPIIQYAATVHGAGTIAVGTGLVTGDIEAATSQIRTIGPAASAVYTSITDVGVYFSCTTAYTAGTGTSVTFTLVYELVTATV